MFLWNQNGTNRKWHFILFIHIWLVSLIGCQLTNSSKGSDALVPTTFKGYKWESVSESQNGVQLITQYFFVDSFSVNITLALRLNENRKTDSTVATSRFNVEYADSLQLFRIWKEQESHVLYYQLLEDTLHLFETDWWNEKEQGYVRDNTQEKNPNDPLIGQWALDCGVPLCNSVFSREYFLDPQGNTWWNQKQLERPIEGYYTLEDPSMGNLGAGYVFWKEKLYLYPTSDWKKFTVVTQ